MESITIKVDEDMAREIDKAMKPDYSTKTEFIREAIRDKLKETRKETVMDELLKHFGKAKVKTTLKEDELIREKVGKEFLKDLEKQIGSIPNKGNSVMQVRRARKILSKEKLNLKEINKLGK